MRLPLQGAVLLETSHISADDCVAAQIVFGGFLGSRSRSACSLPHGSRTPARGGYPRLIVLSAVAIRRRQGFGGRVALADESVYGFSPFVVSFTIVEDYAALWKR